MVYICSEQACQGAPVMTALQGFENVGMNIDNNSTYTMADEMMKRNEKELKSYNGK